jgi:hypothetical protein
MDDGRSVLGSLKAIVLGSLIQNDRYFTVRFRAIVFRFSQGDRILGMNDRRSLFYCKALGRSISGSLSQNDRYLLLQGIRAIGFRLFQTKRSLFYCKAQGDRFQVLSAKTIGSPEVRVLRFIKIPLYSL